MRSVFIAMIGSAILTTAAPAAAQEAVRGRRARLPAALRELPRGLDAAAPDARDAAAAHPRGRRDRPQHVHHAPPGRRAHVGRAARRLRVRHGAPPRLLSRPVRGHSRERLLLGPDRRRSARRSGLERLGRGVAEHTLPGGGRGRPERRGRAAADPPVGVRLPRRLRLRLAGPASSAGASSSAAATGSSTPSTPTPAASTGSSRPTAASAPPHPSARTPGRARRSSTSAMRSPTSTRWTWPAATSAGRSRWTTTATR